MALMEWIIHISAAEFVARKGNILILLRLHFL
jgi:hypothetical protein